MFSVVLIAVMICCSFMGYYKVELDDEYEVFFEPASWSESDEDTRRITISPITSIASVSHIISFSEYDAQELNDIFYDVSESDPSIDSDAKGLAYLTVDSFKNNMAVNFYYIALMLLSVLTPIFLIVVLIIALTKYIKTTIYKKEHTAYLGCISLFRMVIRRAPLLLLIGLIVSKVKLGNSAIAFGFLCCLGILVHMVCSCLKDYTKAQRKYRTMLQCVSLLGVVSGVAFIVYALKCNLVLRLVEVTIGRTDLEDVLRLFEGGNFSFVDDLLPLLISAIFIAALISVCRPIANNLCRVSLTTIKVGLKNSTYFGARIAQSIFPNFMTLMYLFFLNSKLRVAFYGEEQVYFWVAMGCVFAMTLTEILLAVLSATLCIDLGNGGKTAVLDGSTYTSKTESAEIDEISGGE
jgi:hypothetical protein